MAAEAGKTSLPSAIMTSRKPTATFPAQERRGNEARARSIARLRTAAVWLPVAALAGAACARLLNVQFWPAELLWHFTAIFLYLSIIASLVLVAFSFYWPAAAAAMLAIFFGFAVYNVPGGMPPRGDSMLSAAQAHITAIAEEDRTRLRLVTHNLYIHNQRREELAAWLRRQDADVIVMQEIDSGMAAVLEAAADIYPHQFFGWPRLWVEYPAMRSELNGLAILSRHPLDAPSVFQQTRYNAPVAFAGLSLPDGQKVRLVVVHAANPLRRSGLRSRNRLLTTLADALKDQPGPLVVAGDFNATPYTPAFAEFVRVARLTASRRYPGTYPQFAGALGLPIDHVLVRDIHIDEIEALDAFGSDHRPLRAELVVTSVADGKP